MRMVQPGNRERLHLKALVITFGRDFDSDRTSQPRVDGAKYLTHTSLADLGRQLIWTQQGAFVQGCRGLFKSLRAAIQNQPIVLVRDQ
jgi:hypothetical protein